MSYPDLPSSVVVDMADIAMRQHHDLWHLVRRREDWDGLSDQQRASLEGAGWKAPRFEDEAGAGLDFLGMHREMIAHVNHLLHNAQNPDWPKVTPWSPIPWNSNDSDWPVPQSWNGMHPAFADAKGQASAEQMKSIAQTLMSEAYLRSRSLDEVGTDIEFSIHGWMHLRWSAEPKLPLDSVDPRNDWLGAPFSSHVNKHFWKLHGWIDARIDDWARANNAVADLSSAWAGPGHHMMASDADREGLRALAGKTVFRVDREIVQRLNDF